MFPRFKKVTLGELRKTIDWNCEFVFFFFFTSSMDTLGTMLSYSLFLFSMLTSKTWKYAIDMETS